MNSEIGPLLPMIEKKVPNVAKVKKVPIERKSTQITINNLSNDRKIQRHKFVT